MGSACFNTMRAPKSKSFYFAQLSGARIRAGKTACRYAIPAKADSFCTVYGRHCPDMRQKMGLEIAGKAQKRQNGVKSGKKTTVQGHFLWLLA